MAKLMQEAKLRDIFKKLNVDGERGLTRQEVDRMFEGIAKVQGEDDEWAKREAEAFFTSYDRDGNNKISYPEFRSYMKKTGRM